MARDFVINVLNPDDPFGPRIPATIPGDLYLRHYKHRPVKYMNLIPARDVLINPLLIFEGVREFNEGGWCWIGRPVEYYLRVNVIVPLEQQRLFAVYLNPRMFVYEWRLEVAQESGSPLPCGHATRFGRLAWRSTS